MNLALIAAMDRARVIGRDNDMPWHLPSDLAFFKRITMGKALIVGRKTYESIGRPLPGRRMVVVTRQSPYCAPGCEVVGSLEDAFSLCVDTTGSEIIIGGGGELYRQSIERASRIYLTDVHASVAGDVHFVVFDPDAWQTIWCQHQPIDARHENAYRRRLLVRHQCR